MINITLVRHWEADWNVKWILMWWREGSFLTKKWIAQAEVLGKFLQENKKIDIILSSPVERAKQTAIILQNFTHCEITYFDELKEIDWWDKTGFLVSEITEDISKKFLDNPYEFKHVNWESMKELFERIWKFCENNFKKYEDKNIMIVSHDNVIKGIIAYMKKLDKEAMNLKIENACYINDNFDGKNFICNDFNKKI